MAIRDTRTVRLSNEFIKILDSTIDKFKTINNITLSYSDVSKAIVRRLDKINFCLDEESHHKIDNSVINISFIEEEITIDKKMDAEHYATGYFKNLGYQVYYSKKIFLEERKIKKSNMGEIWNNKLSKIMLLYNENPMLMECIHDPLGIPDLAIFKDGKFEFIEVKTGQDGLGSDQLKWMKNHPNVKISVFYLNQIIAKK
jgi:hypothetical protein